MEINQQIEFIFKNTGYRFSNFNLLELALRHSSKKNKIVFERLEFLGDRILNLVVSEFLYNKFPNEDEGFLSSKLSTCVNKDSVLKIAEKISLDKAMQYNKESISRHNDGILCDGIESLIGAMYIDSDYESVRNIILKLWREVINEDGNQNVKTILQEMMHEQLLPLPIYEVERIDGKDHNPTFLVSVEVKNKKFYGTGKSKKLAENAAAKEAIKYHSNNS